MLRGSGLVSHTVRGRTIRGGVLRLVSRSLTTSHAKGPSSPELLHITIPELLKRTASKYPDNAAVISMHQNNTLITYKQLDELSTQLALNLMTNEGIAPGDNVAVCCANRWEFPIIQMGLAKLGAVLIPLNTAFTDEQFKSALAHSGAKLLLTQDEIVKKQDSGVKSMASLIGIAKQLNIPVGLINDASFPAFIAKSTTTKALPQLHPDDVINMQFTSGTTSAPKLSALTHINLVNNGNYIGHRMKLSGNAANHPTKQDHLCISVPMFHCFGLVLSNLAALSHGACLVYPSELFDAEESLKAVAKYQCTGLSGVPTMFAKQLEIYDRFKGSFKYLRTGIAAGSAVPVEMMHQLMNKLNMTELVICYGMTETSPVSFMTVHDDPVAKRCETVGRIMPNTEAKIVNPANDSLEALPVGSKGEIIISGYLLQKEYFQNPEETAKHMIYDINGVRWMRTGDEGMMDSDGYLTITGRIKDLIIRGGENIHPLEIENMLFTHPKVSQASVVGVPDAKYGEAIVAYIIPHDGVTCSGEEIQDYVRKNLGPFMTPEYVIFVNDYPKTESGKIRKVELRESAKAAVLTQL
ncbi:oxalate--CoA ligase [Trichomonascus vanleenenianus]|uniref:oxalate--CoA ligase n=1 Tax=Trichomonascus vanleenenianus TaxID=2268995 RepID=UPI003ECA6252